MWIVGLCQRVAPLHASAVFAARKPPPHPGKADLVYCTKARSTAFQIGDSVPWVSARTNNLTVFALLGIFVFYSLVWVVCMAAPKPKAQAQRIHAVNQITMTMTSSNAPQIAPLKLE